MVWLRLIALAVLLLGSGCSSLSQFERERAVGIALQARSDARDCQREDNCAADSPLRALAGEAFSRSQPSQPVHYATILDEGEASLVARINLLRSATRSIDLQTYIFDTDDSARLVIDELLAAARRGVKVRLLIDQLSAITDLQTLGALAGAHHNLQLRVYNPTFGKATPTYLHYAASVICCFRRFNQRMHNKLLVIDDAIGVVGGRNYQDDYYDWDTEYNFRDRDVIISGPEVREMAVNFDAFWAAPRAVPVEQLNDVGRYLLRHGVPALPPLPGRNPERVARAQALADDQAWVQARFVDSALEVGPVHYVADLPDKHQPAAGDEDASFRLDRLLGSAQQEVLLQTPYLVMSDAARDLFGQLRQRPQRVRVKVSTNSLAATDNPIVYALSYKYKRRNMRELGMEIYEYKPFPLAPPVAAFNLEPGAATDTLPAWVLAPQTSAGGELRRPLPAGVAVERGVPAAESRSLLLGSGASGRSQTNALGDLRRRQPGGSEVERDVLRAETRPSFLGSGATSRPLPVTRDGVRMGLHAKSLVIDRRIGVIGTHNFDPRSENYNTEAMVVIEDAAFAQALAGSIEADMRPENSWVVAPRQRLPVLGQLNYSVGKASEALPVLDVWPWRYATVFEYQPSAQCPQPLSIRDPQFYACYRALGDFPEVNVGGKWLLVRMLTAFGAGLVPIL
ncbi:phospholipase D family protein [Stenotrophomonas koreensis]|uniref:phospholipase D family protein n=1 Tax=Stenotrophomonas koreensis TaxID=266128 RepID=UPI003F4A6141